MLKLPESYNRPSLAFRRKLLCVFAVASALSACETVTEIDLPQERPQLVVNAIFNADSSVNVNLTESKPVGDPGHRFKPVEDARIELFENDLSLGMLEDLGTGNYRSLRRLGHGAGSSCRIQVTASGFETAGSEERIPVKPDLSSFSVEPNHENSNTFYKSYKATLVLNDPVAENYYFLRIWLLGPRNSRTPVNFKLNNKLAQIAPPFQSAAEMVLFADKAINSRPTTLDIDIIQTPVPVNGTYRISIEVGSTPQSYYDYQVSVRKQMDADPVFSPGDNPVSNNIRNGLGIFAPYTSAEVSFDVVR